MGPTAKLIVEMEQSKREERWSKPCLIPDVANVEGGKFDLLAPFNDPPSRLHDDKCYPPNMAPKGVSILHPEKEVKVLPPPLHLSRNEFELLDRQQYCQWRMSMSNFVRHSLLMAGQEVVVIRTDFDKVYFGCKRWRRFIEGTIHATIFILLVRLLASVLVLECRWLVAVTDTGTKVS